MQKLDGGSQGIDNDFAVQSFENIGAWILGRNMFGPIRGPWPDDSWKGWRGDEPPYRVPVFVLTHHAHAPLAMKEKARIFSPACIYPSLYFAWSKLPRANTRRT